MFPADVDGEGGGWARSASDRAWRSGGALDGWAPFWRGIVDTRLSVHGVVESIKQGHVAAAVLPLGAVPLLGDPFWDSSCEDEL